MNQNGNGNGKHIIRNRKMRWIAAGVTLALMAWFTAAFFRNQWNMLDVPIPAVYIGFGIIASYAVHNKAVSGKCPEEKDKLAWGDWIFISALLWAGIMLSLYQAKAFEKLWGINDVAIPGQFFEFLGSISGLFGLSSIFEFVPRLKLNNSKPSA